MQRRYVYRLCCIGCEHVLSAYKEAVEQRYRFFSFGDAMFIH